MTCPARARHWLGVDLGTSGVKSLLVDDTGAVLARGRAGYPTERNADLPSEADEQSPLDYLGAVAQVIQEATPLRIDGIGIIGQTPTVVLAESDGTPIGPALTWRDGRPHEEAATLGQELPRSEEILGVSNMWVPGQMPAKVRWLRQNRPDNLDRARWIFQPKDYLGFVLTGAPLSDSWSSKGLRDTETGTVPDRVAALLGISPDQVPSVRSPWHSRGTTQPSRWFPDLPAGIPVAIGWTDALAGMVGIGAFAEPTRFILTGTSDIVGATTDAAEAARPNLFTVSPPHAPLAIHYGPTQSAGASLNWLSDITGRSVAELSRLADEIATETTSTALFVPYLRGERAPLWDLRVRGRFTGLSDSDGPASLAAAVMRGVALADRHVLEATPSDPAAPVHVGGAYVADPAWLHARAITVPAPLVLHTEPELPALGAAMLARAAGTGESLAAASVALGSETRTVPSRASAAHDDYPRYLREVASALADVAPQVAQRRDPT